MIVFWCCCVLFSLLCSLWQGAWLASPGSRQGTPVSTYLINLLHKSLVLTPLIPSCLVVLCGFFAHVFLQTYVSIFCQTSSFSVLLPLDFFCVHSSTASPVLCDSTSGFHSASEDISIRPAPCPHGSFLRLFLLNKPFAPTNLFQCFGVQHHVKHIFVFRLVLL